MQQSRQAEAPSPFLLGRIERCPDHDQVQCGQFCDQIDSLGTTRWLLKSPVKRQSVSEGEPTDGLTCGLDIGLFDHCGGQDVAAFGLVLWRSHRLVDTCHPCHKPVPSLAWETHGEYGHGLTKSRTPLHRPHCLAPDRKTVSLCHS